MTSPWTRFATTDPEAGHDHLRAAYVDFAVRTSRDGVGGGFRMDTTSAALDSAHLSRFRYSADSQVTVEPLTEAVVVARLTRGRYRTTTGRDDHPVPRGGVVALPTDRVLDVDLGDVDMTVVTLPRQLLEGVAEALTGRRPSALRILSARPVSEALGQHWSSLTDYAVRVVLPRPELAGNPLVVGPTLRVLASATLAAFPNTLTGEQPAGDGSATPAAVRRAVAHIDDHADRDLSLAGVAAAAGIGPRALQATFTRHLATTPMAYVRRVRMEHAHRDLQVGDPTAGATVAAVAARWGFTSPGRFAAAYRQRYGQPPSRTLRA